ncbi:CHAT domain containing protein [Elaphomyces granulatus]
MDIEQFAAQDIPKFLLASAINAYERHMQSGSTEDIDIARRGEIKDLEEAIQAARQASRYERIGEVKDEEAIQTARQAVESTPADHPDRAARLNNLGNMLRRQYERTGDVKDLEEAIQTARQAVESMPADHPDRTAFLDILGNQLLSRYERTGEVKDLEEAIQIARQAVELTPADHPDRARRLNCLGTRLGRRYEWTGEVKDLGEAIQITCHNPSPNARQAVELTPADRPDRAGILNCIRTIRGIPDYGRFLLGQIVAEMQECAGDGSNQPTQGLPKVWWIRTGLASSMPFHAAGLHTRGSIENAYSRVISSYTPSIKALAHARNCARSTGESRAAPGSLLITTMPTTPRARSEKYAPKDLPGAVTEKDEIIKVVHDRITIVLNQPSAEQVLESLESYRVAHFSCHGISDSLGPSNSGLILQKSNEPGEVFEQDRLTAHRIAELQLVHTDCCVEVARRFYSSLFQQNWSATGSGEVASALQEAVVAVRAEDITMPLNWAQFVHYGA